MRRFIPLVVPSATTVKTQSKTASITTNGGNVTVTPDAGYYLDSAKVTANIPTEEKAHPEITENGTYTITPDAGKLMSKATVSVNVPTGGGLAAWIREQSVTTFIPTSTTNEPLTVALSGLSGAPEIIIILTSVLAPTVVRTFGGGVYTNNPNGIAKRAADNIFSGVGFVRHGIGDDYVNHLDNSTSGPITDWSASSVTITPPTYDNDRAWIEGAVYTIIAIRTKTP